MVRRILNVLLSILFPMASLKLTEIIASWQLVDELFDRILEGPHYLKLKHWYQRIGVAKTGIRNLSD